MSEKLTGTESEARELDERDEFSSRRDEFELLPYDGDYSTIAYFAGNSLGLQPKAARPRLLAELDDWAKFGVEGHIEAQRPWLGYHEFLREPAARLVGAKPHEVVMMNTLTVNLHLMMISFYRPTADRFAIVIEDSAFPSDSYAVRSQAAFHGFDPDLAVIRLRPREGENNLRSQDVVEYLQEHGEKVAMVLLGGVNYYSGELMDMAAITAAGHDAGAVVGFDLAHAAGNVPLHLHDWGVDWAAWCSYKYLNGGPGGTAGAFVHERHLADGSLPKFHGWWSTKPEVRFEMDKIVDEPASADSWSVSNPSIFAMAPVLAAMEMFDEVGMETLRAKSKRLTGYLEELLRTLCHDRPIEVITPTDPEQRGSQLSVRVTSESADKLAHRLRHKFGVIADARRPDVIRLAPIAMYSTYHDCWRAAVALREATA